MCDILKGTFIVICQYANWEKSRYYSFDMNFTQDFPLLFLELNVCHIERKFCRNLSICELRKVGPSHHPENVWISDKTRRCTVIRNWKFHLKFPFEYHSVLERIWIKGSNLSQWLPQGERRPPKESKSRWIEIFHSGSH